ncbi:2-C-methyl-D-erythritol 4-phosphate cytidylyltransferase [Fournierella massiliensis]|nr:2-C-methyl-D-erythritol 4-phosphate cytidylyltransferase [Fournierella massiliensis]
MRTQGMPKQFLSLYGKPIICYTLEVFEQCEEVDQVIIPCNKDWISHMSKLVKKYNLQKVKKIIPGGSDRQSSILNGLNILENVEEEDLVLIHDGVRPLVKEETILENIRTAREHGNAMTVKQNIETVVVTEKESVGFSDFKNRDNTFTLTSPQTFRAKELMEAYKELEKEENTEVPILDASLLFAHLGKPVYLVKESGLNLKITTPEDFYYLRAYLELNENKEILGV